MENSLQLPHAAHLAPAFTVRPPGSKSIANRVLPLAALGRGTVRLDNLPDGDDVTLMRKALGQLGYGTVVDGLAETLTGTGVFKADGQTPTELFLGNSGTATRILTALLAAGHGTFRVTGVPRMYERPIGDLVDALNPLRGDTEIIYEGTPGFPPLTIKADGLAGGTTKIRGNLSSQFVTGLLMAMPLCRGRVEVAIEGTLVSAPYVDMTLRVMEDFGARVQRDGYARFWIDEPTGYTNPASPANPSTGTGSPTTYVVEPDASSASYFLAAAAICNAPVTVEGIGPDSTQGEARFVTALERMGANATRGDAALTVQGAPGLRGIDIDMDLMSDTGMTLAVTALFAQGRTTIRNVGNWRLKETDRLAAMATELRKLGATVDEGPDWIAIDPPAALTPHAVIDTYDDHRMAMCFSLVTLGPKGVPVVINDPGCVRKTYPGYWATFARMTGGR